MIAGRLKNGDGEIIADLQLPEFVHEIKLSQYVNFVTATKKITADTDKNENPICAMADAIKAVTGCDINKIYQAQVGADDGEDMDGTVKSMYGWIAKVLLSHQPKIRTPESHTFQHGGETFEIPYIIRTAVYQDEILPNLTTGQAVSVFEMMRLSERETEKVGDPNGNRMYTDYLELLSFLALKPGESLPVDTGERAVFLDSRVQFFADITADVALDVDFFLTDTMHLSQINHRVLGSLSLPLLDLAVVMLPLKGMLTTKRSRTVKRSTKESVGRKSLPGS